VWTSIAGNHARVADRLHEEHDVIWRLDDLVVSVYSRASIAAEPGSAEADATLLAGQVLRAVGNFCSDDLGC
jgi:hypothetical protein